MEGGQQLGEQIKVEESRNKVFWDGGGWRKGNGKFGWVWMNWRGLVVLGWLWGVLVEEGRSGGAGWVGGEKESVRGNCGWIYGGLFWMLVWFFSGFSGSGDLLTLAVVVG